MKQTYYLVDYENVSEGNGKVLKGCSNFDANTYLYIFYTKNTTKIDLDIIANHGEATLEVIQAEDGKQALDMQLVSFLGYLIGKDTELENSFVIISKDTDYDKVIKFWAKRGVKSVSRKPNIAVKKATTAKKTAAPKKTTKSAVAKKNSVTKKTTENTALVEAVSADTTVETKEKKLTKAEIGVLKTEMNAKIQKALSDKKYDNEKINFVASTAVKHFGEESMALNIHNAINQTYDATEAKELYNAVKTIIRKYAECM